MTDVYHEVMRTIWDHNLHFGLWTSEEDESSNRVAAERMTALHIDKLGARHGWRVLDLGRRVGTSASSANCRQWTAETATGLSSRPSHST